MNGSLSTDVVRFGKFEVDLRARELRKGGARIRLQDQPFQILAMMLERPGELVTRDELEIRLWPDGTTVDFEHGVNAAVKRLRAALGDDADNPRFIETLHRRGYRFIASIDGQSSVQKPRMAVLPFDNVSQDAGQDYFSDGLTSELIAQLGKVGANRLGVIARTSAMAYRASAKSASEIGRALSVQYLLEGSVRREGDRVRIAAQLIETRGETQLWAQTYERDTSDCFSVQADVASRIVQSLAFELFQGRPQVGAAGTKHPGAYQAYLKGRYQWNKPADEGLELAITHFTEAIRLDPEFADAHASLARVYVGAAEYYARKPRAAFEAARSFAERALAIEPSNCDAHLALGDTRRALDWDWKGAEDAYRAALAFNPSSESAHRKYAVLLAGEGRNAEAAAAADRACDLDPLCLVVNTAAASVRYFARNYDDAITRCRHTLDIDAGFMAARRVLASALVQVGQHEEALAALNGPSSDGVHSVSLACLAHTLAAAGHRDGALAAFARLDALASERWVSAYHRAVAACGLGQFDRALSLLAEACEERDPSLSHVAVEPRFDPLRADPRFAALLDRLALR